MPTYDFQCQLCRKLFEGRMTMAEYGAGQRPGCPDRGDSTPTRLFTASINVLTSHATPASFCQRPEGSVTQRCGAYGGSSCGCI